MGQLCGDRIRASPRGRSIRSSRRYSRRPSSAHRSTELKSVAAKAAHAFKESCGGSYAMTPPGRFGRWGTVSALRSRPCGSSACAGEILHLAQRRATGPLQRAGFRRSWRALQRQPPQDASARPMLAASRSRAESIADRADRDRDTPGGHTKEMLDRLREATRRPFRGCKLPARMTCRSRRSDGWRRWRSGSRP